MSRAGKTRGYPDFRLAVIILSPGIGEDKPIQNPRIRFQNDSDIVLLWARESF
jgi:hypothetical protein